MMRFIVSGLVAVGLFAATAVLRSHSIASDDAAKTAMIPSVLDATDSSKLPDQVMDDRSVVYPQQPPR